MGARASRRRIVLLSGGLDSGAVLFAPYAGETSALFVDYGQVSAPGELAAARRLAAAQRVELEIADIPALARLGAGRLSRAPIAGNADGVTELQCEEWFPARNLALLAVAAIALGREGGGDICVGASEPVYRDGQQAFFSAAESVIRESLPLSMPVAVTVPETSRAELLRAAVEAGLEPRSTFSCNRRGDRHCWRCASCRDRAALLEVCSSPARNLPGLAEPLHTMRQP